MGRLGFNAAGKAENFLAEVAGPIRRLAGIRIDVESGLFGLLAPGSISEQLVDHYRTWLFTHDPQPRDRPWSTRAPPLSDLLGDPRGPTLQDLPIKPRFTFNATNLMSGALWRFSRPYMADYRVGMIPNPTVELAIAVAASSAFPPFLSPLHLTFPLDAYAPPDADPARRPDLTDPGYRTDVVLTDGGVYDNLGLETAWKRCRTVLVSDGGGKMAASLHVHGDWARQMIRVADVIDNQVRSLRKRELIDAYRRRERLGAYWSLRTDPADYPVPDPLLPPPEQITRARGVATRPDALDTDTQESLVNWGYAACDLGLRGWADRDVPRPDGLPYPPQT